MEELNDLTKTYYELRDQLKKLLERIANLEQYLTDANARLKLLTDKNKHLNAKESVFL